MHKYPQAVRDYGINTQMMCWKELERLCYDAVVCVSVIYFKFPLVKARRNQYLRKPVSCGGSSLTETCFHMFSYLYLILFYNKTHWSSLLQVIGTSAAADLIDSFCCVLSFLYQLWQRCCCGTQLVSSSSILTLPSDTSTQSHSRPQLHAQTECHRH